MNEPILHISVQKRCFFFFLHLYKTYFTWFLSIVVCAVISQQTQNAVTTSSLRHCNVTTLQRRCDDVVAKLCVCWDDILLHVLILAIRSSAARSSTLLSGMFSRVSYSSSNARTAGLFSCCPLCFSFVLWLFSMYCRQYLHLVWGWGLLQVKII